MQEVIQAVPRILLKTAVIAILISSSVGAIRWRRSYAGGAREQAVEQLGYVVMAMVMAFILLVPDLKEYLKPSSSA